jgi:hypothetical protein
MPDDPLRVNYPRAFPGAPAHTWPREARVVNNDYPGLVNIIQEKLPDGGAGQQSMFT